MHAELCQTNGRTDFACSIKQQLHCAKGAFRYDVRTRGGRGVMEKRTWYGRLRALHSKNQFQMWTKREGVKKSEILQMSYLEAPKVGLPGLLGARACPLIFRVICFTYALPTSPSAHSPPPPPPPANPIRARTATLKFPKMGPSPLSLVSDRMSRRIFGIPSEYSAGDIVAF